MAEGQWGSHPLPLYQIKRVLIFFILKLTNAFKMKKKKYKERKRCRPVDQVYQEILSIIVKLLNKGAIILWLLSYQKYVAVWAPPTEDSQICPSVHSGFSFLLPWTTVLQKVLGLPL